MERPVSNYEIAKQRVQKEFVKYDISGKVRKWNLQMDEEYIYLKVMTFPVRIHRQNGLVEIIANTQKPQEAGFDLAMMLYDILCDGRQDALISGEYLPVYALAAGQSGSQYAGQGMFKKYETLIDANQEGFRKACEALGGIPFGKGDISYKLPLFEELYMIIEFWEADDEFPPQVTVFVDKLTLLYMHYETIWYAMGFVFQEIQKRIEKE